MKKCFLRFVLAATAALLAACSMLNTGPEQVVPLNKKQLEALAARGKLPQLFGIAVYPSDNGPVFGGVMRTHEGEVETFAFPPFETSFAPIIPAGIGRTERYNALLDTSAQQSWVTLAMMKALNVEPLLAPSLLASRPTHVFDNYGAILGVAGHLKIGETISLENVLLQVRGASGSLGPLARGLDNEKIDIVLGLDFLKAFNHVTFAFPSKYVLLSASLDCKLAESNLLASVPMDLTNGTLIVRGMIDGVSTNIMLDTGGDYAVALPADIKPGRLNQVSVGDLVIRDLPATSGMDLSLGPITQPRIGRLALSRFKVTLDFHDRLVHFEKP